MQLEAQLELKITANAGSRLKLEKVFGLCFVLFFFFFGGKIWSIKLVYSLTLTLFSGGAAVGGGALACAAANSVRPQSTRTEGPNGED